jgi:rhomboid protease GluP
MASPLEPASPADVLRWCAAAAPGLWFPSAHAATTGTPRDALDDQLWKLRQAGLVQVGDWVKGRGQGFAVTPAGTDALADPAKLARAADPPPPPPVIDVPPAAVPDPTAPPPAAPLTRYDRGELARQAALSPRRAVVTPVLIGACGVWFLAELLVAERTGVTADQFLSRGDAAVVLRAGGAEGTHIAAGEWWRLLSAGFVHIGLAHLLANMLGLGMAGPAAEGLWGRWRFAVIYFVGVLAGNCLAMATDPGVVLAGASGAIWAVLASLVVWILRNRQHLPEENFSDALRRLLLLLAVNGAISLAPGISWQAHFGGGAAGAVAAVGLDLARPGAGPRRFAGWLVVGLAVLAGPAGLVAAGRPVPPPAVAVPVVIPIPATPVGATHVAVTIALVGRTPGTVEEARRRVADLRAAGGEAAAYAALADALLAAGRVPSKPEWDALKAAKQLAEGAARP